MMIIKVSDKKAVNLCIDALSRAGIIIYPTETVYGIGADATNCVAVKKVFDVKRRYHEKNIILAFSDIAMIKKYMKMEPETEQLAKKFMPGPFTIIDNGVGFRIPDHKFVLSLIKKFGKPITTTSANISDQEPLCKISDIIKTFSGNVDVIVDAGDLPKRQPSTIFDIQKKEVVRQGPVSKEEIMKALS